MIILGIDPGYALTGWGVIKYENRKFSLIEYGCVDTKPAEAFTSRLMAIYDKMTELCDKYHPDCCSIEELFFNKNVKTAIAAAQGRGTAVCAVASKGVPVYEYTPLQVKQSITGYGRADKKQIQEMVKRYLNLKEIPKPDDAADALAIAMCHTHWMRVNKSL